MTQAPAVPRHRSLRARLHEVVFEADTPAGTAFDVVLILSILASVVVMLNDGEGVFDPIVPACLRLMSRKASAAWI